MIIGQVIHWIVNNKEVYFEGFPQMQKLSEQTNYISHTLERIIEKLKHIIPLALKEEKTITINHFLTFYIHSNTSSNQKHPFYQIHSDLATIINCKIRHKPYKAQNCQDVYKSIASSLMIERETVQVLLNIFVKAINDMVVNGNKMCINLQFCLIKISKKQFSCVFRKSFIKDLNTKQQASKKSQILLHLCPTTKCKQNEKQNITKAYEQFYAQKWRQIEQGNLFNRASLRQIKNLYDKGRNLQIKYKHLFE